jgi:hypothetical protein
MCAVLPSEPTCREFQAKSARIGRLASAELAEKVASIPNGSHIDFSGRAPRYHVDLVKVLAQSGQVPAIHIYMRFPAFHLQSHGRRRTQVEQEGCHIAESATRPDHPQVLMLC